VEFAEKRLPGIPTLLKKQHAIFAIESNLERNARRELRESKGVVQNILFSKK
jgi:hypothetical protein